MKDSVHVGDNSGARAGDINIKVPSENPMPQCPVCYTPLSNDPALNNGLICGDSNCSKRFCEQCESFYRASRKRGEMPYCFEHYKEEKAVVEESPFSNSDDPLAAFAASRGLELPSKERAPGPPPLSSSTNSIVIPEPPLGVPQRIEMRITDKALFNSISPMLAEMPNCLAFDCVFKNEFPKTIRAFKGSIRFSDLFHHHILSLGVTIELNVKPMKTGKWTGSIKYNQFVQSHSRLGSIKLSDLGYELEIESVVFADGSRLPN